MASFLTRQYRRTKNYVVRNSGTLARGALVATAAIGGTALCLGGTLGTAGPAALTCGAAAGSLADAALGGVVERNTRRATQSTFDAAQDFFDDPVNVPAPAGLITSLSGLPLTTTTLSLKPISKWSAETIAARDAVIAERSRSRTIKAALSAAALGLGAIALIKRGK